MAYATNPILTFLLYDIAMARQVSAGLSIAERKNLGADIIQHNKHYSESYWRHEQDINADVVRQMAAAITAGAQGPEPGEQIPWGPEPRHPIARRRCRCAFRGGRVPPSRVARWPLWEAAATTSVAHAFRGPDWCPKGHVKLLLIGYAVRRRERHYRSWQGSIRMVPRRGTKTLGISKTTS